MRFTSAFAAANPGERRNQNFRCASWKARALPVRACRYAANAPSPIAGAATAKIRATTGPPARSAAPARGSVNSTPFDRDRPTAMPSGTAAQYRPRCARATAPNPAASANGSE